MRGAAVIVINKGWCWHVVVSRTSYTKEGDEYERGSRVTIDTVRWRVNNDQSVRIMSDGSMGRYEYDFGPDNRKQAANLLRTLLGPKYPGGDWV